MKKYFSPGDVVICCSGWDDDHKEWYINEGSSLAAWRAFLILGILDSSDSLYTLYETDRGTLYFHWQSFYNEHVTILKHARAFQVSHSSL